MADLMESISTKSLWTSPQAHRSIWNTKASRAAIIGVFIIRLSTILSSLIWFTLWISPLRQLVK